MRFRASRGYRAIELVAAALFCAMAIPAVVVSGDWSFAAYAIGLALLWLAGLALRTWVYGVTFDTDAVVIQGVWRRTIPRTAISDVSTREWWGTRRIVLAGPKGPVRLPVPTMGPFTFDAAFDAKAQPIKDWAASGRLETTI